MGSEKVALIFGCNGFVGPYLAKELRGTGYKVVGSDRTQISQNPYISVYECADLLDATRIASVVAIYCPDLIVNLAAISSVSASWKAPQTTMQVNVIGTLNVLEAAKNIEGIKVMLIGSSEEYAPSERPLSEESPVEANNPYGVSKATQERFADIYADRFGMQIYRVRAFNHTGIGQAPTFVLPGWCSQVATIERSGRPGVIRVGNLDVRRDFSDVCDVVRAYRLITESDQAGEVFNVGSGVAYRLRELLGTIVGFCSQEIEVQVNEALLRPSDNPVICCDNRKAADLVGWKPEIDIHDTLREIFESFQEVGA